MSKYGEPWKRVGGQTYTTGDDEPLMGFGCVGLANLVAPNDEYQDRINACVNACTGIPDPATAIKTAREAMEFAKGELFCDPHVSCDPDDPECMCGPCTAVLPRRPCPFRTHLPNGVRT